MNINRKGSTSLCMQNIITHYFSNVTTIYQLHTFTKDFPLCNMYLKIIFLHKYHSRQLHECWGFWCHSACPQLTTGVTCSMKLGGLNRPWALGTLIYEAVNLQKFRHCQPNCTYSWQTKLMKGCIVLLHPPLDLRLCHWPRSYFTACSVCPSRIKRLQHNVLSMPITNKEAIAERDQYAHH
jgi:hypothetical protein